jgi:putative Holliday junction resolvase
VSKVLAVDPGEARIGVAVSDPTGTIARPLMTLTHASRSKDAEAILDLAKDQQVDAIVVGLALDDDGQPGHQARRAMRLVESLRAVAGVPVTTWDESGSTQAVRRGGVGDDRLDARAAAVILQDYLDARKA